MGANNEKMESGTWKSRWKKFNDDFAVIPAWVYGIPMTIGLVGFACYGFLLLVIGQGIGETPALIMVWASVALLFIGAFPGILDRIRKVKMFGVELELGEVVKKEIGADYITSLEFDKDIELGHKGGWPTLFKIAAESPDSMNKSFLLVVDLRDGNHISIPMLFGYLTVLGLLFQRVDVLFIKSKMTQINSLSEIGENNIVGVISGARVHQILHAKYPLLLSFYSMVFGRADPGNTNEALGYEMFYGSLLNLLMKLEGWYEHCRQQMMMENRNERLSERDVISWFGGELSNFKVSKDLTKKDMDTIRDAIFHKVEFLLVLDGSQLQGVVEVCRITSTLSEKVLKEQA